MNAKIVIEVNTTPGKKPDWNIDPSGDAKDPWTLLKILDLTKRMAEDEIVQRNMSRIMPAMGMPGKGN